MSKFYQHLGNYKPLSIIAGPCVYEDYKLAKHIASELAETCDKYGVNFCFKMSYDKANRTSHSGYRGKGLDAAMEAFMHLQAELNIEILTDVHDCWQAQVINADILQIFHFYEQLTTRSGSKDCRYQCKEGQVSSCVEMEKVVDKIVHFGNRKLYKQAWHYV